MTPVVAVIAPGAMGAAVGKRLADNGRKSAHFAQGPQPGDARRGRRRRAWSRRATKRSPPPISCSRFCRPATRCRWREHFAPALTASNAKPVYVDCNAINPATVERVAAAIAPTGCPFVDAGIIGPPPRARATAGVRASTRPARPRRALCHAARLRPRHARAGWRVERGFGAENVLCRHHQRHAGDRRRDDAGGNARRFRRCAVCRAAVRARRKCWRWFKRGCR